MSNEIQLSTNLSVANGSYTRLWQPSGIAINQNAVGEQGSIVSVATTHTDIAFTVSTVGYAAFRNLDLANYVQVGSYSSSTFFPFCKLKAGEFAVLRLDPSITGTLSAIANTATCKVQYWILND